MVSCRRTVGGGGEGAAQAPSSRETPRTKNPSKSRRIKVNHTRSQWRGLVWGSSMSFKKTSTLRPGRGKSGRVRPSPTKSRTRSPSVAPSQTGRTKSGFRVEVEGRGQSRVLHRDSALPKRRRFVLGKLNYFKI